MSKTKKYNHTLTKEPNKLKNKSSKEGKSQSSSFIFLSSNDSNSYNYDENSSEYLFDTDDYDYKEIFKHTQTEQIITNDNKGSNDDNSEKSSDSQNHSSDSPGKTKTRSKRKNRNKTKKKRTYTKRKTPLTRDGLDFKTLLNLRFEKNQKKIPKPTVKLLFNFVCESLNLPKMSREEERSINKFFNNYAHLKFEIINAIAKYIDSHPESQALIEDSIQKGNGKKSITV